MTDMRPVIRRLHSPDIDNLEEYQPTESDRFGFLLQMFIGPETGHGEESFDIMICTPRWLLDKHSADDIVLGRHMMIVFKYDYQHLLSFLHRTVAEVSGEAWIDVAQVLSRLGRWEFEDYVPA